MMRSNPPANADARGRVVRRISLRARAGCRARYAATRSIW